jgi:hypothetical protein
MAVVALVGLLLVSAALTLILVAYCNLMNTAVLKSATIDDTVSGLVLLRLPAANTTVKYTVHHQ